MKDNRDAIDFSKEPVNRLFRKMFLPTLIGMVSMVVLNITDGAFVGHGVGSDALAAVNIVAPLFMIEGGLGLMFGIGSSVVASIHLSQNNSHAANLNLTQGIAASILTGVTLAILTFTFQEETCRMFGCSESLLPLACSYLKWIALLTPFNMFGMTGMFMVRLDGSPRFAMVMNCSMALSNIVMDYVFIYPLQMGLEGAALATTLAFGLGNIPLTYFLLKKTRNVHLCRIKLSRTSCSLTARNLLYQTKIGLSALLGELAIASIMIVGNYVFMRYLGEDGVAAFSVGCYCLPIVFMMGNAIVQSVQPIVSYAYGAGDPERLAQTKRLALKASIATGIAGMMVILLGGEWISSTFLNGDCRAYDVCKEGLPYYSPAFLFIAINIVQIGYLQSTEQSKSATIITLMRGFVLSIPCFLFLPQWWDTAGLWLALPLAEMMTMVGYAVYFLVKKH